MVPRSWLALRPVDKLLAGYLGFATVAIITRGQLNAAPAWWMLVMHVLIMVLLVLFSRLRPSDRTGQVLHDLYPLILLLPFYAEIGFLNGSLEYNSVMANDAVVQRWESVVFGGQISYTWLRTYPSVFWSGTLHLAYLAYYPIVIAGPIVLAIRRKRESARTVILSTMIAFVICYVGFIAFPVGGPNYAFDHPSGPVRDVWSARFVYAVLAGGSSFGAAFPSSHVAATVAATIAMIRVWKPVGLTLILPCILLTVGTVYCQMHYGIDATSGLIVGVAAALIAGRIR